MTDFVSKISRKLNAATLFNGGLALIVLCLLTAVWFEHRSAAPVLNSSIMPAVHAAPSGTANGVPVTSYADVIARVAPAVVTIRAESRVRPAQQFPFADDPFFQQFFGGRLPRAEERPQRQIGLGSGVIVSADGYILTNHHVIDGAEKIKVDLADHRTFDAKVVGTDAPSDLAVLKIEAHNLPVLPLGDSDQVRVGDVALAIGNPLGVGQTVTSGIISAKGRSTGLTDGSFEDFLQTDAPINQGNSGGALINTRGELIGINSQILSPSGGNIGIGFAIPSNMARNVMDQLIASGKVRRGRLGIGLQDVTSDMAQSLGLKQVQGVIVTEVEPGSPAAQAGLRQGDIITRFNNQPVSDRNSLRNSVATLLPGTNVELTIIRDGGREQNLSVKLGELSASAGDKNADQGPASGRWERSSGRLGLQVEPLTAETRAALDLPADTQGVVVRSVDPDGPAADSGIQPGDVIMEINRQPVRSVAAIRTALEKGGQRPALLLVNRRGNTFYVTVRQGS